jgi:hypothetical protein
VWRGLAGISRQGFCEGRDEGHDRQRSTRAIGTANESKKQDHPYHHGQVEVFVRNAKHSKRLGGYALAAALFCAQPLSPLHAQEEGTSENSGFEEIKEELSALATKIETLRSKQGDTLKDGAGGVEAAILSSEALNAAADTIASDIQKSGKTKIVIMSGGALPDTDSNLSLSIEIDAMRNLLHAQRPATRNDDGELRIAAAPAIAGISNALELLTSLLRSETEISNLPSVELNADSLGVAVANSLLDKNMTVTLPNRILLTDWKNDADVRQVITDLRQLEEMASAIRTVKSPSEDQTAALKRYADFLIRIQMPNQGKVPLLNALRAAKVAKTLGTGHILEVKVEKIGGTLLKRKNLAVILGASALGVTGGSVISYSLTDANGTASAAGLLHCGTTLTSFRKVHRRQKINGRCNREE